MAVDDWDDDPLLNNIIEGENIAEGMLPGALNNWARKICAAIKVFRNNAYCKDKNVTIQPSGGAAPATPAVGDLWIEYTP